MQLANVTCKAETSCPSATAGNGSALGSRATPRAILGPVATAPGGRMVLVLLIKHFLLAVKRRWTVDASVALIVILVLSMTLMMIMATGVATPRDEILIALLR